MIARVLLTMAVLCLPMQELAGTYVIDEAASDDIRAAIDAATRNLNFIKRPIARKRLRATNPPTRSVRIRMVGDSVEVVSNDTIVLRNLPDGAARPWRGFKGEELQVSTVLADGVLTNTFKAADGERRNTYRLRADGMLELSVRLTSPHLEGPVEYRQVLRRTD